MKLLFGFIIFLPLFGVCQKVTYIFDSNSRLIEVQHDNCWYSKYSYDKDGNRLSRQVKLVDPGLISNYTSCGLNNGSLEAITPQGDNFSYIWSTGSTSNKIDSLAPGTYKLTIRDLNNVNNYECTKEFEVPGSVNPIPEANITYSTPTMFCRGDSILLTASPGANYLYHWFVNNNFLKSDTVNKFTATSQGSYFVRIEKNGCTLDSKPVDVIINNPAIPTILSDTTVFCTGDSTRLRSSIIGRTYLWSTGQTTSDIFVKQQGFYALTITDNNGCKGESFPVQIRVNPLPQFYIDTSGPTNFCQGDSITLSSSIAGSSYIWSNGSNTRNVKVKNSGKFSIILTNSYGCKDSRSIDVKVNPLPNVRSMATDTSLCLGDTTTFIGSGAKTYIYSNGVLNGVPFVPGRIGENNYILTGIDSNNCINYATQNIYVNALPVVIANASKGEICKGDSAILLGSGAVNYQWSNNVIDRISFIPNATNNYKLTGIDQNGCRNTDSITIVVNPLPPVRANTYDAEICKGESTRLFGSGAIAYQWSNNVINNQQFKPDISKFFKVIGTDNKGCKNEDSIYILVNPLPIVVAIASQDTVCFGDDVILFAMGANKYIWDNGVINNVPFKPNDSKLYTVIGTDNNECRDTTTQFITVHPLPIVDAGMNDTIIKGNAKVLGGNPTASGNPPFSYVWDPAFRLNSNILANPIASPDTTTQYIVFVYDRHGCISKDSIIIFVKNSTLVLDQNKDVLMFIFPNPSDGRISIRLENILPGRYEYEVLDEQGKTVHDSYIVADNGEAQAFIELNGLPVGAYLLRIIKLGVSKVVLIGK